MEIQKEQVASSNLFDQLIDQYKLEAHINQTAITDLYRAFDVDENRSVAIEILLPLYNNKKQFVQQFINKMNKVAKIKHPNIAQVHQIGTTPNERSYFAREMIEGISLSERLAQISQQSTTANVIYALKIMQQLAEALEMAERLDLYHYHLAPENIMLKQDGTVVLVDLGIPVAENGTKTQLSSTINTSYVAPEQSSGNPIDSRSQIYSLGVILYEILTGELPERPSSFWHTFSQAVKPKNSALELIRPDLSRQTYNLIEISLRKQTWGRYGSIKEFLEAINEALQNERMLVQTRGNTAVVTPPAPRRSRAVILIPLLVIAFCIGSFAIWVNVQNSNDPSVVPLAVNTTISSTNTTIPENTQSPTAVSAFEPTITTAVIVNDPINILAPASAAQFEAGEAVTFRWTWAATLQKNQRFSVYLLTGNGRSLLGTISTPAVDGNYSLQTLLPASGSNAAFEWQVLLEDINTNREIVSSNNQQIIVKPIPITPTFTPSPTLTATPTNTATPTPIPQIQVVLSSASLRRGPSTIYPILRFLFQGDVAAVLAKDSLEGEWYNVILDDGTRGWIAASVSQLLDENSINFIPIAATIPPRPTNTPTSTPTNTPTPTNTATPLPPATKTPTSTAPPPPTSPPPP